MNTTTPSTSLVLPNIIARYALQSLVDVLQDNTRTFYIQKFSIRNLDLDALESISANVRDLKHGVAYSGSGEDYDWSIIITYNANGAGWGKFSLNDYSDVVKPQVEVEPTKAPSSIDHLLKVANYEKKFKGFEYIITFEHDKMWAPSARHTTTPDVAIRMARMVVAQYPQTQWIVTRRSDGVVLAQNK